MPMPALQQMLVVKKVEVAVEIAFENAAQNFEKVPVNELLGN